MAARAAGPGELDRAEWSAWVDLYRAPALGVVEEQRMESRRFGPVQALASHGLPRMRAVNLVLGAAEPDAVEDGYLDEALAWMESLGIDFRVPVTPQRFESDAAEEALNQRGYRRAAALTRYVGDVNPPDFPPPDGLSAVELSGPLEGWSELLAGSRGPAPLEPSLFECLPGREMWHCYAVRDANGAPVGAAAMVHNWQFAHLAFMASGDPQRGEEVQLALLREAILTLSGKRFCAGILAEVPATKRGGDSPPAAASLLRAGFRPVAPRPVWHPPKAGRGR